MARSGYERLAHAPEQAKSLENDELEQAFESDDEDHDAVPLNPPRQTPQIEVATNIQDGAYDFEREYDHPPPGSPPRANGNSNGIIPSFASLPRQAPENTHPSFFRRAVGALLPQHYARVPTSDAEAHTRIQGSGLENDGVFSNVLAKPTNAGQSTNGNIHEMPEDAQKDAPPSYAAAQADAVPPYWETTVHAPAFGGDDLLIDGLPSGTVFSFAWNCLVSITFQFVGFMLTYLLHTTHAGKYGSRAGLGVTLIQYGLYSKSDYDMNSGENVGATTTVSEAVRLARRGYQSLSPRTWMMADGSGSSDEDTAIAANGFMHDWISFFLMTIGWFLLLSSILGYARVKRWEHSIRTPAPPITQEVLQRDDEVRSRLRQVFGLDFVSEREAEQERINDMEASQNENDNGRPRPVPPHEEDMRRELRSMGLI
ncbi:metal homeostatis bsd2 [Pyrrhoderma noxium]|uniref:Metal homeostatis bsd2 n=1 Tax=Pyrrhoderma noxium TaxID=2282107 RepID=A0A286U9H8_9AGAM|nr:metal homeostatis bsd2 [Pyrrhoderma noxium]